MLTTLFVAATILAGALSGNAIAQSPDTGCALPSEPQGIPAAIDAAISGAADQDRACMKVLLIAEAPLIFVSLGADAAPKLYASELGRLDRPRQRSWPCDSGRKAAEISFF